MADTKVDSAPFPSQAENDTFKAKVHGVKVPEKREVKASEELPATPTQEEHDLAKATAMNQGKQTETKKRALEAGHPAAVYETRAMPPAPAPHAEPQPPKPVAS